MITCVGRASLKRFASGGPVAVARDILPAVSKMWPIPESGIWKFEGPRVLSEIGGELNQNKNTKSFKG